MRWRPGGVNHRVVVARYRQIGSACRAITFCLCPELKGLFRTELALPQSKVWVGLCRYLFGFNGGQGGRKVASNRVQTCTKKIYKNNNLSNILFNFVRTGMTLIRSLWWAGLAGRTRRVSGGEMPKIVRCALNTKKIEGLKEPGMYADGEGL